MGVVMKTADTTQLPIEELTAPPSTYGTIILNKERFAQILADAHETPDVNASKNKILALRNIIVHPKEDKDGLINIDANGDTISLRRDVLISELDQILEARTGERARYYLRRLAGGIQKIKTNKINDINLNLPRPKYVT